METAHRQTSNGTARFLGICTVSIVDKIHDFGERGFKSAVHCMWEFNGRRNKTGRSISSRSLLVDVSIRHYHNHRFRLALCDEVIHNLCDTPQRNPSIFVATHAVQQVENGVFIRALLVTRRRIPSQATVVTCGFAVEPNLRHRTVRHIVHRIEVALRAVDQKDIASGNHIA